MTQSLKQKIKKLWNKKFNEPLDQTDLNILLTKKGENYKYIKQNQNGTVSLKTIPITKFSNSYTHKKSQQNKFNTNKLITESIYSDIPPYLTPKQLLHMGLTSKYLDTEKTYPSKYFLTQAQRIYPLSKKIIHKIRPNGRFRPMNHQYFLIPNNNIRIAKILFPIRALTTKQMDNIKQGLQQRQIRHYELIHRYLFTENLNNIIDDDELTLEEKTQLCHLNKILKILIADYLTSIPLNLFELKAERIKRIIQSLKSNIEFPKYEIVIPPLTDNQIINIFNALEYIIENIPNEALLQYIMNS